MAKKNDNTFFQEYPFSGPTLDSMVHMMDDGAKLFIKKIQKKMSDSSVLNFIINVNKYKNPNSEAATEYINTIFGSKEKGQRLNWVMGSYSYSDFIRNIMFVRSKIINPESSYGNLIKYIKHFNFDVEPNTENEQRLYFALINWFNNSTTLAANVLKRYYTAIRDAREKWPAIFKPHVPDGKVVFRGIAIRNFKTQLKAAELTDFTVVDGPFADKFVVYKKPLTYKPERFAQSFTDSPDIALGFTPDGYILMTKCNDEFFFNKNFAKFASKYQHKNYGENEIIHLGTTFKDNVYLAVKMDEFQKLRGKKSVEPSKKKLKAFASTLVGKTSEI